jgi:HEPN domain-containing protein
MRKETKAWISKANKDLGTASIAHQSVDGPLPVTTGLHCQQSAEKYLKAFLQEYGIAFSNQHSLVPLLEACISIDDSFERLRADINRLEGYSIAARYPRPNDSKEYAGEALSTAKRAKEFVLDKLA